MNCARSKIPEYGIRGIPHERTRRQSRRHRPERPPPGHGILKAAHFAANKHSVQRRKGAAAEPYINHLLEVAELVSSALVEPDTNLVIAALLHDTIEDTATTKAELIQAFGADVA
jgi:(p)ppGpp synthase/HD superfamily hydrolase